MSMKTGLIALALSACLALAGCFTSEQPLFDAKAGVALFGKGHVLVTTYKNDEKPDTGDLDWTDVGYIEVGKPKGGALSFHKLPNSGWFSHWYVGQTNMGSEDGPLDGWMYMLYRKDGEKLFTYDLSCSDLTDKEVVATHLTRKESECKATAAADLAKAFRILSKRKTAEGYMVAVPAK
jgi:hypothetical protein